MDLLKVLNLVGYETETLLFSITRAKLSPYLSKAVIVVVAFSFGFVAFVIVLSRRYEFKK